MSGEIEIEDRKLSTDKLLASEMEEYRTTMLQMRMTFSSENKPNEHIMSVPN